MVEFPICLPLTPPLGAKQALASCWRIRRQLADVLLNTGRSLASAGKSNTRRVDPLLIERDGAVSEMVARAMACGALQHSQAQVVLAITEVADPSGGRACAVHHARQQPPSLLSP